MEKNYETWLNMVVRNLYPTILTYFKYVESPEADVFNSKIITSIIETYIHIVEYKKSNTIDTLHIVECISHITQCQQCIKI